MIRMLAIYILLLCGTPFSLCLTNKVTSTGYNIIHSQVSNLLLGTTSTSLHPFAMFRMMPNQVTCANPPPFCKKMEYRTFDGSCNHLEQPQLGMANSRYGRLITPRYSDGVSAVPKSVTGKELPNARAVSIGVFGELDIPDPEFTLINMQWGQIITHDMSMQAGGTQSKKHPTRCCTDDGRLITRGLDRTCFSIIVSHNDPVYSKAGVECLNFVRSLTDLDLKCPDSMYHHYAEQLTTVTAYMDLSLVYGSSEQTNNQLREFHGGRMIVEERHGAEWLPSSRNMTDDCDGSSFMDVCYRAGDTRVNQNPGLTILQTILLREHNRIADTLSRLNHHWDDNKLFQEARKINIGQYQHISYYEWLPIFLGWENMMKNRLIYKVPKASYVNDYNPTVDPSVLNSHATAAFRYFHSQIEGRLDLITEMRTLVGSLRLSDWMNRPGVIELGNNFDSLSRGHATQPQQLTDMNFDSEIKHFLFKGNMKFGSDLIAIDIQRNRDHGLASYNDYRDFCGVGRAYTWKDFSDLIDMQSIQRLQHMYEDVDDVDVYVGGSLEAHVAGTLAGPTFLCILTEQFYRSRVGDRYFYENGDKHGGFKPEQLAEIRKASMARLLCDNGNDIESMQPKAFLLVSHSNSLVSCDNIPEVDLSKWEEDDSSFSTNFASEFIYGK